MAAGNVSVKRRSKPSAKGPSAEGSDHEDFYRSVIDHAADAIVTIDETGIMETVNVAAEKLFGYSREELVGQNVKMLVPSPDHEKHDQYLANYLRTGEKRIVDTWREVTGKRKDGSTVPIQLGVREIPVDGRRMFSGILTDLTEIHRVQKELENKSRDMLELSTPVISLWEGVLAMPLIGTLDSRRAMDCIVKSLEKISELQARVLIIDITGVPVVDTLVANHLIRLAGSIRLMGGHCVLTGISPPIAMSIVSLGIDLATLKTRATLADGLKLAIELTTGTPE